MVLFLLSIEIDRILEKFRNADFEKSYIEEAKLHRINKLKEAMQGMMDLLTAMLESESNMESAQEGVIQKIRTERLTKSRILSEYQKAEKMGVAYDIRQDIYKSVPNFTMDDLSNFHNSYIKNDNYTIMVLGNKDLKLDVLRQYGEIKHLTLEDVFGY